MSRSRRYKQRQGTMQEEAGMGIDFHGGPVIDPTKNVLDLVLAAVQRQDDLRRADALRREDSIRHVNEVMALRADYDEKLRRAETARIDAIRAVDVGAVNRAAEVASAQAQTLASQVAQVAEAMRAQQAAATAASEVGLKNALDPMQKAIDDLRRAQYEAQGVKSNVGESRLNLNTIFLGVSIVVGILLAVYIK